MPLHPGCWEATRLKTPVLSGKETLLKLCSNPRALSSDAFQKCEGLGRVAVITWRVTHQDILSDFLTRLSPSHPEIGMTGTELATNSLPADFSEHSSDFVFDFGETRDRSVILLMPTMSCLTPTQKIDKNGVLASLSLASPALWSPLAIAAVKFHWQEPSKEQQKRRG